MFLFLSIFTIVYVIVLEGHLVGGTSLNSVLFIVYIFLFVLFCFILQN